MEEFRGLEQSTSDFGHPLQLFERETLKVSENDVRLKENAPRQFEKMEVVEKEMTERIKEALKFDVKFIGWGLGKLYEASKVVGKVALQLMQDAYTHTTTSIQDYYKSKEEQERERVQRIRENAPPIENGYDIVFDKSINPALIGGIID